MPRGKTGCFRYDLSVAASAATCPDTSRPTRDERSLQAVSRSRAEDCEKRCQEALAVVSKGAQVGGFEVRGCVVLGLGRSGWLVTFGLARGDRCKLADELTTCSAAATPAQR